MRATTRWEDEINKVTNLFERLTVDRFCHRTFIPSKTFTTSRFLLSQRQTYQAILLGCETRGTQFQDIFSTNVNIIITSQVITELYQKLLRNRIPCRKFLRPMYLENYDNERTPMKFSNWSHLPICYSRSNTRLAIILN